MKEDLALIEFPSGICIDVGWYVSTFAVLVVRDDWDQPLLERRVRDVGALEVALREAIEIARRY